MPQIEHALRLRWRERERESDKIQEEALEVAAAKYLASDSIRIVRVDCFQEAFEEFWDTTAERYPNIDFLSIMPNEGGAEAEEEEQVEDGQRGEVATEGAVEEAKVAEVEEAEVVQPRESGREEVTPGEGEVAMGDDNPQDSYILTLKNSCIFSFLFLNSCKILAYE